MRKLISLGLLALFLSAISSQLLAGGADWCDERKKELQALDAYGLCVAWHKANGNAKDKIADQFFDLTGLEVGGSGDAGLDPDFECPCWDTVKFPDVCAWGPPTIKNTVAHPNPEYPDVYLGFVVFGTALPDVELFGTDLIGCGHTIGTVGNEIESLTVQEGIDCGYDLGIIASLHATEICVGD